MIEPVTTAAALVAAVAAARAGDRDARFAVVRAVAPGLAAELLHATTASDEAELATGIAASPGAGTGRLYLSAEAALDAFDRGEAVVLAGVETTPADEPAMRVAEAILTSRGGLASHAAVVARGFGVPAVCGAEGVSFADGVLIADGVHVAEGALVTVDGSTGRLLPGDGAISAADPPPELDELLAWADEARAGAVTVLANADTGIDVARACAAGAEGVGLCRTEHQFLGDRLPIFQRYLLADDAPTRTAALAELARAQEADFVAVLAAAGDRPVVVRLLDPPLHEFLPDLAELLVAETAGTLDAHGRAELEAARRWHETNPMIGTRGVRLAVLRPELYRAQVDALLRAVTRRLDDAGDPRVGIMIPLVVDGREVIHVRRWIDEAAAAAGHGERISVGAMIETPRAALCSGAIAYEVDFVSYGTNDLTQMTFGFSRDDVETRLLARYLDEGLLDANPFETLDLEGVGGLLTGSVHAARAGNPTLRVGVCGEHGGDPRSIEFFVDAGLDSVSCSPFRVPVARLASAQAVLARSAGR